MMIVFKKKSFAIPAILGAIGKDLAVQGAIGVATTKMSNNAAAKQAEDQMQEQRRLQKQQLKAQAQQNQKMMDTLKQVAKTNPNVAGAAAGQMMQQQFAIPASALRGFVTAKGAVKDLAKVSKQMGIHKHAARGLAMGATVAGANYLVDKAIQADAKRSGIDLGETEDTRKEHGKKLAKAAGLAATAGLAIAGAKRGYLGKGLKNSADKYITKANLKKGGNMIKDAFTDQFVDKKAWNSAGSAKDKAKAIRTGGIAITGAFAASPVIGYLGTKKAIKDQAKQSEEAGEERTYSAKLPKVKIPQGIKGFLQKKVKPALQRSTTYPGKSTSPVASFKEAPVRNVLGKVSSFFGGGGQEGTAEFTKKLMEQGGKSGNKLTQSAANFLDKHKTLAVGGSIAVGSALMKPWEYGSKAVQNVTGAVDKNAMRYEKSQNKQVEEE